MTNVYEATKPVQKPVAAKENSNCGCWVAGCLTVILLGILGTAVAGWLMFRYVQGEVDKYIQKYTSETPVELPVVEYDDERMTLLEAKVEEFKTKLENGEQVDDLELSADDVNALINANKDTKGRAFVRIEDGRIEGDVSIPLDNVPFADGRYFNASAAFDVSMANGVLIVTLAEAEVKGEKVPEEFVEALRKENLAKGLYDDPEMSKKFRRIESVIVEQNKIVLKVKRESEATEEQPQVADEPQGETSLQDEGEPQEPQATDDNATPPLSNDPPDQVDNPDQVDSTSTNTGDTSSGVN